jgi:HEAT repeat protein
MSKRRKILGFGLLALIVGIVAVLGSWSREPSYRGRTLTSWLQQCWDAPGNEVERRSEAEVAIRTIGAEKAMRHLVVMAETQDGPVRSWIIRKNGKWNIRFLKMREADLTQQLGIAGFEVLGTNCAAAVPQLTRLMEDTNHAFTALRCLVGIGEPAETPVCQALTNRSPEIRRFAASQLAWVTDDIDVYLARLGGPLNDPDTTVRFAAVQALGLQTEYPNEVIPLLVKAMHDPQQSVSGYAAKFLGEFGTNGVRAFGELSSVVENGNPYMASHALRSLVAIDPNRALPMVLRWLRSSEPDRRSRAAWVLGEFRTVTPEILDALKSATADSDSKVVHNATVSLTKYRQMEKEHGGGGIVIEGEPSYGGRPLGAWLKQRPDKNEPSEETKHAVREMGTNAIPALLARLVYRDQKFRLIDYDAGMEAVGGFVLLGEEAVPALPKLEELVNGDDQRIAAYALIAACNMGTSSVPIVTRALTNRHADVRNQAVGLFSDGPMRPFLEARKNALPEIAKLLCDPDEFVRMNTTNALKEIDPEAAARAGVK